VLLCSTVAAAFIPVFALFIREVALRGGPAEAQESTLVAQEGWFRARGARTWAQNWRAVRETARL
jgi:hypothetical protein